MERNQPELLEGLMQARKSTSGLGRFQQVNVLGEEEKRKKKDFKFEEGGGGGGKSQKPWAFHVSHEENNFEYV